MKQGNAGTVIVIETCEFLIQGVKWILVLEWVKKNQLKIAARERTIIVTVSNVTKTHDKFRKA